MPLGPVVQALDYVGVATFAVSGSLAAGRKQMDPVGFVLVATVTGIGGGTLRDLLLGRQPVFWIEQPAYVAICVATAIVMFFIAERVDARGKTLLWGDAVGLAVFAVIGAEIGIAAGAHPLIAAVMGVITATFGGMIRDVLCGESPLILQGEIYATAALAGGIVYVMVDDLVPAKWIAVVAGVGIALSIRGAAIIFHLSLPTFRGQQGASRRR